MTDTTKKVVLWIPYLLTMAYLAGLTLWIRFNTGLDSNGTIRLVGYIVLYSALMVGSSDIRRCNWAKKK